MTEEVARLFEEARQLPREARAAFVEDACRGDAALRDEIESLLMHADAAERFFDGLGGAVRAAAPALDRATLSAFTHDASASASASLGSSPASAESDFDPMIGAAIGHYRILALLGRGGMGTVYRAHDERLDREVALKFLPWHAVDQPDADQRLLGEARAAAGLTHPNVCTVHEIG